MFTLLPKCGSIFGWRRLVAFAALLSPQVSGLLDSLEELLPVPRDPEGRKEAFLSWLERAAQLGLLRESERDLLNETVRLRLHEEPDPMYLAMFAHGDDDLLYEEAERERQAAAQADLPKAGDRFRVADDRRFVEVRKTGKRTGVVLRSNFLPRGTEVRSQVNWPFAAKPRNSWSQATLVSPRTLKVLGAPGRRAA